MEKENSSIKLKKRKDSAFIGIIIESSTWFTTSVCLYLSKYYNVIVFKRKAALQEKLETCKHFVLIVEKELSKGTSFKEMSELVLKSGKRFDVVTDLVNLSLLENGELGKQLDEKLSQIVNFNLNSFGPFFNQTNY